jgi:hypothetical protein
VLEQLDRQQLPLVVPFVHRRVHVEPFVTLQTNEPRAARRGERLGDLGFADAGIALDEQRAAELQHQHERRGKR